MDDSNAPSAEWRKLCVKRKVKVTVRLDVWRRSACKVSGSRPEGFFAQEKSGTYSASLDLMTDYPSSSSYERGRGRPGIVEWKTIDGCGERRRVRAINGERETV
jgi:hypothetical protein